VKTHHAISLDPIIGDEQAGGTYLKHICGQFHHNNKSETFRSQTCWRIVGTQIKFLAQSGHHAWHNLSVSIRVAQMLETR
jgi:hypothetical protein